MNKKEYIEREAVKGKFSDALPIGRSIRDTIDEVPTADVVPKSEWDRIYNELESLKSGTLPRLIIDLRIANTNVANLEMEKAELEKLFNDMTQEAKGYLNRLCGIRAEVAREIFEEIDQIFRKQYESCSKTKFELLEPILQGERFIINEMWHKVAELKKKYTEEN